MKTSRWNEKKKWVEKRRRRKTSAAAWSLNPSLAVVKRWGGGVGVGPLMMTLKALDKSQGTW